MSSTHTIPPAAPTTTKRVFDYLLDDAAVYAVFNHQIADLPNPQSPYKKDNPKTWGDGTLIDFGDGTAGVAKKLTFDKSKSYYVLTTNNSNNTQKQIYSIVDWGGSTIHYRDDGSFVSRNIEISNIVGVTFHVEFTSSGGSQQLILMPSNITTASTFDVFVWAIVEYNP